MPQSNNNRDKKQPDENKDGRSETRQDEASKGCGGGRGLGRGGGKGRRDGTGGGKGRGGGGKGGRRKSG